MYTPFTSRHFTRYTDPQSGITMAILSTHVARVQKGVYFVNPCTSKDGRYLWFSCAFHPGGGCLAVIDFLTDEIHSFLDTSGSSGHLVEPETGNIYFSCAQGIFCRSPHPDDKPVLVARLPEICREHGCSGGTSHLTFTPDRKELVVDYQTSNGNYLGSIDVVTGEFTQWYHTEPGRWYNHAQCCPTDGNLMMCAHEMWNGLTLRNEAVYEDGIYPRIQFITREGKRWIIRLAGNEGGHEFWAPDGKSVYYVNNDFEKKGYGVVARGPIDGSEPEIICKITIPGSCNHVWHTQCTQNEKYFLVDGSVPSMGLPVWRGCSSAVHFFNKETQKLIRIVTNPVVEGWTPENSCPYHIDPHPRFEMNDTWGTFTTTVLGRVDVAVVDVAQLIEATK